MKKEYSRPVLEVREFDAIENVSRLSDGGTLPGIGNEGGNNGSVNWGDIY